MTSAGFYGLRWLMAARHHPAAYMATTGLQGMVQSADYGMSSGLSQSGIPNMDFGSLLQGGLSNFSKYQSTLRQYQAAFGDSVGTMGKEFKKAVDDMQGGLNNMGYTRQNLVEYMDTIGRATGRTSGNLAELTKNTLAFARAYSVSDTALRATAQTFGRVGAVKEPWQLGSQLSRAGIATPLLDETLSSLSNLAAGQMDRGGGATALRGSAALTATINRMGEALGPERGGAYLGAGAVRLAGNIDAGFAAASPMAMIANPIRAGEGYGAYRARLENPDAGMLDNAITRARRMGPDAGAIMLVKGFGMSYTDAKNLIEKGGKVSGLGSAEDYRSVEARARAYTTQQQFFGAKTNDLLTTELGPDAFKRMAALAKSNDFANYKQLLTGQNVETTILGVVASSYLNKLYDKVSGGDIPEGTTNNAATLQSFVERFNKEHGSSLRLSGAPFGSVSIGDIASDLRQDSGTIPLGRLRTLKTAKDSADFKAAMADMGGVVDWGNQIVRFSKAVGEGTEAIEKNTAAYKAAEKVLKNIPGYASPDSAPVKRGRKPDGY